MIPFALDSPVRSLVWESLIRDSWASASFRSISSCVSKTDPKVAPKDGEALFILIPVAPNLDDNDQIRKNYFQQVISRIELLINQNINDHIVFSKSYAHRDFISDYNSFKGNAYGLANTLFQTAFLKPKIKNKKINNLYYTGQLTVPGPGMPPSIVSGKIVADQIDIEIKWLILKDISNQVWKRLEV